MRRLACVLAFVLAVTGGATAAAQTQPPDGPVQSVPTGDHVVTLVTGDRVWFARQPQGRYVVTVDPVPRAGFDGSFQTVDDGTNLYVVPSDANHLIPAVLDRELFNVTKLAQTGYPAGVPVIVGFEDPAAASPGSGMTQVVMLDSVQGLAATVGTGGEWWRTVPNGGLTGVTRVWLDEQLTATLAESVPLIGAPSAWAAGYDGTGVTVAVLDTGIDAEHPDLPGKVTAEANFSSADTADDRHGHGTHVAGIVAGSGAASGGTYTGSAPGASLLNAKVLGDDGSGAASDIIAGMEWAAAQGADVVNMSLTGGPTDGTDPLSLAVNRLTAEHDVLFAIAAGNSGPGEQTVGSPGTADAALTVGSVDKTETIAPNSSRGPRPGDFAVKPDVTAPGVDIVSARAAGTNLGPPVAEQYTRLSGTSMATPHVAGAAAILRQAEPELTAPDVKARLATTGAPDPDLDVHQQGGGRIDVPSALDAELHVTPSPVDLGSFPFPQDTAEPVAAEVTFANRSEYQLSLRLVPQVAGTVAGMLTVEPSTLVIEPGAEARATVHLDPRQGEPGRYGGYLLATDEEGTVLTRTPVGFHKEAERYDLTITGIARDGRPAGGASNVAILNVDDMRQFMQPGNGFIDGTIRVRVPPGNYAVLGGIHTYDAHDQDIQQTTFVGEPEIAVAQDTTVTLDARQANRVTVHTPDHVTRPQAAIGLGYWRTPATPGPILGLTFLGLPPGREIYATPTAPVSRGGFEFYSRWRMAAPEATLSTGDLTLQPNLLRPLAVDGEQTVPLMDVGNGGPDDYANVDATGKAVLARRGPVPVSEQITHAAANDAVALIVSNDVPGPFVGQLADPGPIPALSVTQAEGEALRGVATVRLAGTRWSPYLYDLVLVEAGRVPDQVTYTVDSEDLTRLDIGYHNDATGHPMAEARHFSRPFHSSSAYLHPQIEGPRQRTEYVIGGDAMSYQQTVFGEMPFEARLQEPSYTFFAPAAQASQSWFRQVVRPALLPGVGQTLRIGDTLRLEIYEWVDAHGNHFPELFGLTPYPGDTVQMRLLQDGEQIAAGPEPRGDFPIASTPATYRVELDTARSAEWWQRSVASRTVWTFRSEPTPGGTEVLPLLSVDYLADLDLENTAPPGGRLELHIRQQAADQPPIAGAELWLSYDDGEAWQPQPLTPLGDGRFQTNLPPAAGDFASVRVAASDSAGNRIEQEVIRAWRNG